MPLKPAVTSDASTRQESYREKQLAAGLVQVSAWIPAHAASGFYIAAERLRSNRDLEFGPLRSMRSGKLTK